MTYHRIWKGFNQDPKDHRTRWDDNYVFKKEWMLYPTILSVIPIYSIGITPYYLLALIIPKNLKTSTGNWVIDLAIVVTPFGLWLLFCACKLLPMILKKYRIIIYAPKGVPLK